jgi:hypothetical protein
MKRSFPGPEDFEASLLRLAASVSSSHPVGQLCMGMLFLSSGTLKVCCEARPGADTM